MAFTCASLPSLPASFPLTLLNAFIFASTPPPHLPSVRLNLLCFLALSIELLSLLRAWRTIAEKEGGIGCLLHRAFLRDLSEILFFWSELLQLTGSSSSKTSAVCPRQLWPSGVQNIQGNNHTSITALVRLWANTRWVLGSTVCDRYFSFMVFISWNKKKQKKDEICGLPRFSYRHYNLDLVSYSNRCTLYNAAKSPLAPLKTEKSLSNSSKSYWKLQPLVGGTLSVWHSAEVEFFLRASPPTFDKSWLSAEGKCRTPLSHEWREKSLQFLHITLTCWATGAQRLTTPPSLHSKATEGLIPSHRLKPSPLLSTLSFCFSLSDGQAAWAVMEDSQTGQRWVSVIIPLWNTPPPTEVKLAWGRSARRGCPSSASAKDCTALFTRLPWEAYSWPIVAELALQHEKTCECLNGDWVWTLYPFHLICSSPSLFRRTFYYCMCRKLDLCAFLFVFLRRLGVKSKSGWKGSYLFVQVILGSNLHFSCLFCLASSIVSQRDNSLTHQPLLLHDSKVQDPSQLEHPW